MAQKTDDYLARERARANLPRLPAGAMELALGLALLTLLALFVTRRGPRPRLLAAREERAGYALLVPWAAGFVLFLLGPALVSLILALCEWSPLRPLADVRWVGLANAARLARDPTFHTSLGATLLYVVLAVPLGIVVALSLALLLRARSRLASITRTAVIVPSIVAPVIVGAVFRFLLDEERGPLNEVLRSIGLDGLPWLRASEWVVPSFVLVSLWSVGAQMLVFLAALQALDPTLEEAARIDGAGALRRLWHVVLPQLGPVILFNLVTGTVASFQVFATPYVMTEGGPGDASRFLVLYLYESAFRHLDVGYASALAWSLFLLLALVVGALFAAGRRWVHYRGGRAA
jgi:multiple sugar transport system permease protein